MDSSFGVGIELLGLCALLCIKLECPVFRAVGGVLFYLVLSGGLSTAWSRVVEVLLFIACSAWVPRVLSQNYYVNASL